MRMLCLLYLLQGKESKLIIPGTYLGQKALLSSSQMPPKTGFGLLENNQISSIISKLQELTT